MTDYPYYGTCDSCAQGDRPLRSASEKFPDAWICVECIESHERAVDAATDAIMEQYALFRSPAYFGTELVRSEVREILGVAIVAFCEYDGEARAASANGGDTQ